MKIAQVLDFCAISGKNQVLSADAWPIGVSKDPKGRDIGMLLNYFEVDDEKKLNFTEASTKPISVENFVAHVFPDELLEILK